MSGFRLTWHGPAVEKAVQAAAMKALTAGAEAIIAAAIDEAPVETGTLRRSATVTPSPSNVRVYGSFNTPYARRQHEELEWRHPLGGKAKYLEDPFKRMADEVRRFVARFIKADMGGRR